MKIVSLKDHICTWKVEKRYGISKRTLEEYRRKTRETGIIHGPKFWDDKNNKNKKILYHPKDVEEFIIQNQVDSDEAAKRYSKKNQDKYKDKYKIKLKTDTGSTIDHNKKENSIEKKKEMIS